MTVRLWGEEQLVNTTTADEQLHPAVTALDDGGYVVFWEDDGPSVHAVRGQRYDAAGETVGGEITFSTIGLGQERPAVLSLAGGGFVVGLDLRWSATRTDPGFRLFDAAGNVVGSPADIDTSDDLGSQVSLARFGTGFVEVYQDPNDDVIKLSARDANGAIVNGMDRFVVSNTGANNILPDVAALANGGFVVTWESDNSQVYLKYYDANGIFRLLRTANTTSVAGDLCNPKVTALANGSFVATWETSHSSFPGSGTDLRARVFGTGGDVLGDDFLVNTTTSGSQLSPEIVATSDGGFVVFYEDLETYSVLGQAFDAFGARVGREFIVNTTPSSPLTFDGISAATLADGRIVVTWDRGVDGSSFGIHSQIIDPRDGLVYGTLYDDTLYGHNILNDELRGLSGRDLLYGLGGNDQIYGGNGNDTLDGGKGDDALYGGNGNDVLNGRTGEDDLRGGAGNDSSNGGNDDDSLDGGNGYDTLNGGGGNDTINGGGGNDTIIASDGNDEIDGGPGRDTYDFSAFTAGVTVALASGLFHHPNGIEIDTFNNIENVTGGAGADKLTGDGSDNVLLGNAANDTLNGGSGNDTLNGGAGSDRLIGGAGTDQLTGGTGKDRFVFTAISQSPPGAGHDRITDFSHAQADRIDLATIDAISGGGGANDSFTFVGSAAFTAAGQLRFDPATHLLQGNVNADLAADFEVFVNTTALVASDFIGLA